MRTKVKRDFMIVGLLVVTILCLSACTKDRMSGVDWADLARSAATPKFGKDACGQTLTWSYELGRWEIKGGKEVVAENNTVVRIDCDVPPKTDQ